MKCVSLVFAILLAALACDRIYYADLKAGSSPDQPVFRIGTNPDFSGYGRIYEISVSGRPRHPPASAPSSQHPDTTDNWHLFWEAKVDSGYVTSEVFEVAYGIPPSRFHNTHAPDSLPAGYMYMTDLRCPGLWSSVYFEIEADSKGKKGIATITADQFNHARQ